MSYPIEQKLVVAVASSALFDLSDSHKVYMEQGVEEYRKYQEVHIDSTLAKGVAFPFIKKLLSLNRIFKEEQPIEVVLLSRNSPETGLRVFRSIQHYELDISRAGFFSGRAPYKYLPAYNATLFLSANEEDVRAACNCGFAAGRVLDSILKEDEGDELRIAFDFDGVVASDDAERVFQEEGIEAFYSKESTNAQTPLQPGLLADLFSKIAALQHLELIRKEKDPAYQRIINTAIVTARNAPAHERLVNTLKNWGVDVDEVFFLGGIAKSRILDIMRPHIFFDDQLGHLSRLTNTLAVHIPLGITNK